MRLKSIGSGPFVPLLYSEEVGNKTWTIFWKPDLFHQQWCALSWISFFQSYFQDRGIWAGNSVKNIFSDPFLIKESWLIPWFIRHGSIPESWKNECGLGVSLEKVVLTESWKKAFSESSGDKWLNHSGFVCCMDFAKNWRLHGS